MKELYNKYLSFLDKFATGRNIFILFILTGVIYFLMIFYTIPIVMSYANGMEILDLIPTGYTSEYAKLLFDSLGTDGRSAYLYKQIPLDMVYPLLFIITFSLLLRYIFKKSFHHESKMHFFIFIPLLAGIFDYCENIGIITMLGIYPIFSDFILNVTNTFTILKSFFTSLFFMFFFIGIVALIIKRFTKLKDSITPN